jgi:hypothetical protein
MRGRAGEQCVHLCRTIIRTAGSSLFPLQSAVDFRSATARYEEWLSRQLEIVPADLERKHEMMRKKIFQFFRATFYRWAQLWPELCPELAKAPGVLAVGDLHVENFGAWRDLEGRLIWGINDFDETCRMPYTIDLVRLAASAHLAIDTEQLRIEHRDACAAILGGYRAALEAGGLPWVLAGRHPWLHAMVSASLHDPVVFWDRLEALREHQGRLPGNARRGLEKMMPVKISQCRVAHRVAGLGSLGRQRFVAISEYQGGLVCREAKALSSSAWNWARAGAESAEQSQPIRYQKALDTAIRAVDPCVRVQDSWIVRRLAPDCSKIAMAAFPRQRDETKLLHAMGWETANVHLGSRRITEVHADFDKRRGNWLHKAAARMVSAVKNDWKEWSSPISAAIND